MSGFYLDRYLNDNNFLSTITFKFILIILVINKILKISKMSSRYIN